MNLDEFLKKAAEIAREDCLRFGWLTSEDDVRVVSRQDSAENCVEVYFVRIRDDVRLWTLTADFRGRDVQCTFNPDLRRVGDVVPNRRPNSRLAAHEARWNQS